MKNCSRLIVCLTLLGLLGACATSPATGRRFLTTLSTSEESEIGKEAHPKILAEYGGAYDDPKLQAYVSELGQRLAVMTERQDVHYTFTIINSPDINAFAVPGGYIYVTRGIMSLANNEAELAGVLSHEIGHITARHAAERQGDSIVFGTGAIFGQILGAVTGLSVIGDLTNLAAVGALQSYSRDQEFEADSLGVRYLGQSGYQPQAMASFLDALLQQTRLEAREAGAEADIDKQDFLASHPRTRDRVDQAIEQAGALPTSAKIESDSYLNRIAGIIYGDDPAQGFVRGQRFIHPKLGFVFELPPEYRLVNKPDSVIGVSKGRKHALEFTLANPQPAGDLISYLKGGLGGKIDFRDVRNFSAGRFEAATAIAFGRSRSGGAIALRVIALRDDTGKAYLFRLIGSPAIVDARINDVEQMARSYRRLSPSDAASYKPWRIALVTVKEGDTVQKLSQRMDVDKNKEDWFRVINHLSANDTLTPGTRVKIVTDGVSLVGNTS